MKRSSMKSDITMQSNCTAEGRLFPRRKVASKSHLLNGGVGDFEMELSLAIQESLKYAQQREEELQLQRTETGTPKSATDSSNQCDSMDTERDEWTSKSKCNSVSEVVNTNSSSSWVSEEVGHLKDLLLTQAEFIQCQQEELTMKDRDLRKLTEENNTLQCRLDRMERRLSILRQKEDLHEGGASESPVKHSLGSSNSVVKGKSEPLKNEFKARRKRGKHRLVLSHRKKYKWQKFDKTEVGAMAGSLRSNAVESEDDGHETSDESVSEGQDSENETDDGHDDIQDQHSLHDSEEESEEPRVYIDYPIMQTETMYHLYYPKHLCSSPDSKKAQEKLAAQLEVETPSWRLRPLTNMYQLEGTENITDEAYYKRHQKFEMEEKRRKRWDLQRIRDLRMLEKFQRQKESEIRASQDEVDVETFLPSVHDLTHIEVSDAIPVMAFGQPIPFVSPAEFEIPWEISSGPSATFSSRHRNNGGHGSKRV